jgi:hypothetical protein
MAITSATQKRWRAADYPASTTTKMATTAAAEIVVAPRIVARFLLVATFILASADVITQTLDATLSPTLPGWVQLVKLFDLDREFSLPTWYSIILLALSSVMLALIAWTARRSGESMWKYWSVLAAVFVALSIDEQVMAHESIGEIVGEALNVGGLFFFAWVIPGAIVTALFGLAFIPFLRYLPSRTRMMFLLAAVLYVGGALGMETMSGIVASRHGIDNLTYATISSIEESLEILGMSCFLFALIGEARRRITGVSISFSDQRKSQELI